VEQGELWQGHTQFPNGLVFAPQFLTMQEEQELLAAIRQLPLEQACYRSYVARRRIASFGSAYDFERNALTAAPPLPAFLQPLREKAAAWLDLPAARFAHALLTEYPPGTPLGWHRDVPDFDIVVGISLAGSARMRFRPYPLADPPRQQPFTLELQPRSAYVLQGEVRWRWQHSIAPTKALRYSITLRTPALRRRQAP
jgi:alkylated DNA repair dioxygenase AlkB